MAATSAMAASLVSSSIPSKTSFSAVSSPFSFLSVSPSRDSLLSLHSRRRSIGVTAVACLPSTPKISTTPRTKLFVSGLSFRTTEDSLRNAFQTFGQLVEVNLVMDRIANRPRGFAFLRYATEEESKKAIDGMHGKFLDGRVIFVEVAKPRSELHQGSKQTPKQQR